MFENLRLRINLAKENGLTGSDNWTAAEADMVVDSIMDMTYRG